MDKSARSDPGAQQPRFGTDYWYGLVGPAGMPRALVDKIQRDIVAILGAPEMRESLLGQGWIAAGSRPEELTALVGRDHELWSRVVKTAGVKLK